MTLLEQAANHQMNRRSTKTITPEQQELAMAWVQGKVGITQVAVALGVKSGGVYPFLANALKAHIQGLK